VNKLEVSKSISAVFDTSNITIEFFCKECSNVVTTDSLNCNHCKSSLISGIGPFINRILNYLILGTVPVVIGSIIGWAIGNVYGGAGVGIIIGGLLATSVKSYLFKSEGVWAIMRMGDSINLEFFCPIANWGHGELPIIAYLCANTHNIYKSQFHSLNEQELSIVKKIFEVKIKLSKNNAIMILENSQKIQPVNHPEESSIKIQQIDNPEENSIIKITRPTKTMGSLQLFGVYVDDSTRIVLDNGQTHKIDTYSGDHTIRIQVLGTSLWSDAFSFSLASGETINFSISPRFGRAPLIKLLRLAF
jgi:hypothetical protein